MKFSGRPGISRPLGAIACLLVVLSVGAARAQEHSPSGSPAALPSPLQAGLDKMYDGDPDGAIVLFRQFQQSQPENPLGYLLEADARWWRIYCDASEVKWGMVDAWQRGKLPSDDDYFALTDLAVEKAKAQLAKKDSAQMHLYAGIGLALKARLSGLRFEKRSTAHYGVAARQEFLRAVQLDPNLADAYTGLGLYNYYVDTLSGFVKFLRFLMGIPGGNKEEGIRQLERGMQEGQLTAVEARFYLAKNLRTYDRKYQQALAIAQPLVSRYPDNPLFLLLVGNLHAELGHRQEAARIFEKVKNMQVPDPSCAPRVHALAAQMLTSVQ